MLSNLICSVVVATFMITSASMVNAMEPEGWEADESGACSLVKEWEEKRAQKIEHLQEAASLRKSLNEAISQALQNKPPEEHAQIRQIAALDLAEAELECNKIKEEIEEINIKIMGIIDL